MLIEVDQRNEQVGRSQISQSIVFSALLFLQPFLTKYMYQSNKFFLYIIL